MRILHLSDLHMELPPERVYPGVGDVLDASRDLVRKESPDYVFVTGDLTCHGSADVHELILAKAWLDSLDVPYLCVAGNHDVGANAWRGQQFPDTERHDPSAFEDTNFGKVFGSPPLVVRDLGPFMAIGMSLRAGDPDRVLSALTEVLRAGSKPVVLLGHYPLAITRSNGVLSKFGASDFIPDLVDPLLEIISSHPLVRLYCAGHVHAVTARTLTPGCMQLTAGALGPGASAYRRYCITSNQLTFASQLGPGPLGFWERFVGDAKYEPEYHLGAFGERNGQVRLSTDGRV